MVRLISMVNPRKEKTVLTNGNDCGVFVLVFTEHCVHRHLINFTQADILYFRSKIAIDLQEKLTVEYKQVGFD